MRSKEPKNRLKGKPNRLKGRSKRPNAVRKVSLRGPKARTAGPIQGSGGAPEPAQYRKPGPTGGRLIRQVIGFLREHGVELPLASHILIAASAGPDSIALAHLLVHYGRRVGDRSRITLLHVNHGWRGRESDLDEKFVVDVGRRWGVPVIVQRLKPPANKEAHGWEDLARTERKKVFLSEARKRETVVLTAHHADDLAETVLWRLLTGSHESHGGGIAVQHGVELRPLLVIRKTKLKQYLKEEGESWREDMTNADPRFLRARIRQELVPSLERIFPKAVERLMNIGLQAQLKSALGFGARSDARRHESESGNTERLSEEQALDALISASGLRLRRAHWEQVEALKQGSKGGVAGETHLPGGWSLRREPSGTRWVLEKRSAPDRQEAAEPTL